MDGEFAGQYFEYEQAIALGRDWENAWEQIVVVSQA
jgi:hypothetical protein